jgi:hypothetical protein
MISSFDLSMSLAHGLGSPGSVNNIDCYFARCSGVGGARQTLYD